ncbi:hypothetical protein T4B_14116 [Trichinella pseudospiralis]|uniref:Uncharacterized protein n=1 Tax=Trichinella pseudospiralis TaxID=6337 RepID=A0A0V1H453_TRIPS|nr:hypothetical protein T4A_10425 [Trichinella pseudospiralis]KRZ05210.1 hypothetical protein T4B_13860 [Trichinella pseudospiralis]KRZ05257.1 hypothetical protein T4B_14116 [Trichinella pseudospiralis]
MERHAEACFDLVTFCYGVFTQIVYIWLNFKWRQVRIYRREHSKTVFTKTLTMSDFYANRERLKIAFTLTANDVR